jgi:NAD(P)H-hydrate epimerase
VTDADFYLSRAEVRDLDRRAFDSYGVPAALLMENAGRGCAERLMHLNPGRRPVVVLCGPGNNGGDGFVIARHLDYHGWPVKVCVYTQERPPEEPGAGVPTLLGTMRALPDAARTNLDIVIRSRLALVVMHDNRSSEAQRAELLTFLGPDGWVVDALFGTGLSRPIGPPFDGVVERVNKSGLPVLSVDIPSGLDCDTGNPLGPTVKAAHTATFVAPKLGFKNPAAKAYTGEVHVIDIGAPRALVEEYRAKRTT